MVDTEKERWGTWEELLLACAVNRYGTKSWDSVAMEIQRRSSTLKLLTPHNCKLKYHDLRRRFTAKDDATMATEDDSETDDKTQTIPWLEELRKLRVAELKREVQKYDTSIVSLQLKVKQLQEERDQSLKEQEETEGRSDLDKDSDKANTEAKKEEDASPEKLAPESFVGEPVAGGNSDKINQSSNESNSTDPKGDDRQTGTQAAEENPAPIDNVAVEPDPDGESTKPFGEGSYNGSSDTIAKESAAFPVQNTSKSDIQRMGNDSHELWESVAESKGEDGTKESSDVQSSASLSRRKGRGKAVSGSSSGGEERENEDQSPAIKQIATKSQPLLEFLEILKSNRLGAVFERRLESQDSVKYKGLIRQHIDLETIQTRVEEGWYSDSKHKFFRDLLLLFNNAIIFFNKKSKEFSTAVDLRQLVLKEITCKLTKSSTEGQTNIPLPVIKSDQDLKPKISAPLIACRKRSSITTKASVPSLASERKREPLLDEKAVLSLNLSKPVNVEEQRITKKRTGERGARSSTSSKAEPSNPNSEKKGNPTTTNANNNVKKQNAASFLNRMKRNNDPLLDSLKKSTISSDNSKGGSRGAEEKKEQVTRRSSNLKQVKDRQESPGKRSVGRPPKRGVTVVSLPPPVLAKRSRDASEAGGSATRSQPKKRARR